MNDYWSGYEIQPIFKIKISSSSEKSINLSKMGEAQLSLIANDALILKVYFHCWLIVSFIKSKVNIHKLLTFYCKNSFYNVFYIILFVRLLFQDSLISIAFFFLFFQQLLENTLQYRIINSGVKIFCSLHKPYIISKSKSS